MLVALHDLSIVSLLLAGLILGCAYVIFGMTGFGQNVIAIPFLVMIAPLKFCVPLIALLDAVFVTWTAAKFRKRANYSELAILLPTLLVGLVAGAAFLSLLPEHILLLSLGLLVASYGIYSLLSSGQAGHLNKLAAVPLGFLAGVLSAAFGTGGPVNVIYLAGRIREKAELRASILIVLIITTAIRLLIFGVNDFLENATLWIWWLCVLPVCFAGVRLGHYLHDVVDNETVLRAIRILLTVSGLLLIWKNI
ncbi:MAG: sulfite exporter TauE/SafE family protein [Xanthobacteraceae bacterium]|nr:sulfite exporter TauE/SafE family protein [Xanthobacteraceae bacterium]